MRLNEKHLQMIRNHYPREGCQDPWKVAHIAREIGCTDCAVEYNAAKMGFGKWDYQETLDKVKNYRITHREQRRESQKKRHREKYLNDPAYRRKRLLLSNRYYHEIAKPKRLNHDKKANI